MTTQIAILGAGVMGETLLAALLDAGHPADHVVISERRADRAAELRGAHGVDVRDNPAAVAGADIILLVVKPQDVADLLTEIAERVSPTATVVSLVAGIRTKQIEAALPTGVAVVRAMPNTPAVIGQGVFGISPGADCSAEQLAIVADLLSAGGKVVTVDERQQDAVTAVSGSGPAYVFYLAEAMIAGGVAQGLDPETARALTVQTLVGAAALLAAGDDDPAELRGRVTSPNGTTAAAIAAFDERGAQAALIAGVEAAAQRSAELSK